jgi:hypothetical protein
MQVEVAINATLLNKYYTIGYTAPPAARLADPQKFVPLLKLQTWAFNSLNGTITYSVLNNDTLQGRRAHPSAPGHEMQNSSSCTVGVHATLCFMSSNADCILL